jgi:hypothetical protein
MEATMTPLFRSIYYPSAAARGGAGPVENYRRRPSFFELDAAEVRSTPTSVAARIHNARTSARILAAEIDGARWRDHPRKMLRVMSDRKILLDSLPTELDAISKALRDE